jgi:hypothetical protein
MSMIMARKPRANEWTPSSTDDRVGGLVPRWLVHTLIAVALLLLIVVPLALSVPALTTPSDKVVVVTSGLGLDGGTAHAR